MPKPRKNESKQKFLNRCTAELIDKEGKGSGEAYAMCNAFWEEEHKEAASLSMMSPMVRLEKKAEGGKRTFLLTAYTGKPVRRFWGNDLIIDVSGMHAKESIPVLREHERDRIVGYSNESWVQDEKFYLGGDMTEATADGREVTALADDGFPWQASVGVWAENVETLKDRDARATVNGQEVRGPMDIWRRSLVGEVSFVALGADDRTAAIVLSEDGERTPDYYTFRSAGMDPEPQKPFEHEEGEIMDRVELKKDFPELYQEIEDQAFEEGLQEGTGKGVAEERRRVCEILQAGADFEVTRKAIEDGVASDAAYKLFYESEKARRKQQLSDLESQAPASAGQVVPDDAEEHQAAAEGEDRRAADVIIDEKAREKMKSDGITYVEALRKVRAENPEVTGAWERQNAQSV